MDFDVRPMNLGDCQTANQITMTAFGYTEDRIADLHRNFEIQPEGWFVAERDGRLLGTVTAVDYGTFAHVGKLAVLPQFRRQGVGRSLMEHALAWMHARNIPAATLDATEQGYPLYLRMGFSVQDHACIYSLNKLPLVGVHRSNVYSMRGDDLDAMAILDARIFGGDRSHLLRVLLRDFSKNAFIARDKTGKISGYLFIQGCKLGPFVAATMEDAECLLQAALSCELPENVFGIVPSSNLDGELLLKRYGFVTAAKNRHMLLGKEPIRQRTKIYGQTSFALG